MFMILKTFEQLSRDDLYAIAKIRQDVFIVEQNSVYVDLDGFDQEAIHYLLEEKNLLEDKHLLQGQNKWLIGYGRYRVLEFSKQVKIERVVLVKQHRGQGKGETLINTMLKDIQESFVDFKIILSAQTIACEFYHRLGFVEFGEPYDDGGIEHISMIYTPTK